MAYRRYSFRAYPSVGQARALARVFGCVRVVFNDVIALHRAEHETGLPFSSAAQAQAFAVTHAKTTPGRAFLTEVSATPLQQAVRDADQAYRHFFASLKGTRKGRRVGAPRFRSRRDHRQAARFTRPSRFKVTTTTHGVAHVHLPKIGKVRFVLSRPLPANPSSVTVIHRADGTYHLSFVVDVPAREPVAPVHPGRVAAVDLGLTDFAAIVYTDGTREKVPNPRLLRFRLRRLRRQQRALARKTKGSNNRAKARVQVAATHQGVADARHNFHHQLAARVIRENQAVGVEHLNVVGLARSMGPGKKGAGFRRSVHDAGWGTFLRVLEDKATDHGRHLVSINPAYTSQTCASCGVLDGPKPLKVRVWQCQGCQAVVDRDYNAATNVLTDTLNHLVAAGLAETVNACGADVRLALARADGHEAGTHRTHQGVAA